MKILRCPLCGREFRVADNVLAAYCNVGHATAAYHQGLPAEDGLVYPIGWPAWWNKVVEIAKACWIDIRFMRAGEFNQFFADKLSPADAIYRLYGVHL